MKKSKILLLAGLFIISMASCQKEEIESSLNDAIIDQETELENIITDLDAFSEEIIESELAALKSASLTVYDEEDSCPVITWYRNSEPRKMIIDFGDECEGRDGKVRSGKIIITASSFENLTATRTKTFENFSVNGRDIEGVITRTVILNKSERTRISEVHEDLTITSEGKVAFRTGTMNRKLERGELIDRSDNRISSWGEIVTEWQDHVTVIKTIPEDTPLVFLSSCRQIVSGLLSVTTGENSWSINYGNGDCDNLAVVTRNGIEKIINLGRRAGN